LIQKTKWRKKLLIDRKNLALQRRLAASLTLFEKLKERGRLLSFSSFNSEIDTSLLNAFLASNNRLFLPRVEGTLLKAYEVADPEKQLVLSPLGVLEPDPRLCRKASLSEIDAILVPALGFDRERFRLGYGKGHYDRFLAQTDLHSIGVGFKEQSIEDLFPRDPWDLPVNELILS
jgi:5-formyltetrahydrofolate cyclo-ligase